MADASAKILVADDSAAERRNARKALEAAGYEVVEAVDGQEALEQFARHRPDLVMLDVVMPRLTGLESCRIIKAKAQGSYLPVIMLSTRNSVNARVEGLRSGADDYLGKPYDDEELRARVEALLRTRAILARAEARATGNAGSSESEGGTGTERNGGPPDQTRTRMLLDGGRGPDDEGEELSAADTLAARAESEFERAERYSDPLACVRVALDGRAALESQLGEDGRARVERSLRDLIEGCVRKIDLVFRLDDGSFTILLPNTHFPGALAVAERVCVEGRRLRTGAASTFEPSVSVGVSFYPNRDTSSAADLLRFVGDALERAQGEGGGKICLFQHQGYLYAPEGR